MKKIILFLFSLIPLFSFTQEKSKIIGEKTIRRVSVGAEVYQDFWMNCNIANALSWQGEVFGM